MCVLGPGSTLHFEKTGLIVFVESEILGEGGFSTVCKATSQTMSTKKYAVKKVVVQTDEIKRSVLAEIMFLNEFRHPNIIKMIDSVDIRDKGNNRVICILFPLIARGTLRHVLNLRPKDADRSKLDLAQILRDFKSICSAFNYMHTLTPVSYIHQDIKPEVSPPNEYCSL
jgi:serine/threonine protein kinase